MVKTTFERHELFAAPFSEEADRAWRSLMPVSIIACTLNRITDEISMVMVLLS